MLNKLKIKPNKRKIFKQLVRKENAVENVTFTIDFLKTQEIYCKNITDVQFICFNKASPLFNILSNSVLNSHSELNSPNNRVTFLEYSKTSGSLPLVKKDSLVFIIIDSDTKRLSIKQKHFIRKLQSPLIIFLSLVPQAEWLKKFDHFFNSVEDGILRI